jgi:Holliday junction resolvase RusA-like endonuclease
MESMSIHVFYNCRYDVDNAICCSKFLADYLRNHGYISDDSPRFFTSQSTHYDASVAKDTFVAKIKAHGYEVIK